MLRILTTIMAGIALSALIIYVSPYRVTINLAIAVQDKQAFTWPEDLPKMPSLIIRHERAPSRDI